MQITKRIQRKMNRGAASEAAMAELVRLAVSMDRRRSLIRLNVKLANKLLRGLVRRKGWNFAWKKSHEQKIGFYFDALFSQLWAYVRLVDRFFVRACRALAPTSNPKHVLDHLFKVTSSNRRPLFQAWDEALRKIRNRLQHEATIDLFVDPFFLCMWEPRFEVYAATRVIDDPDEIELLDVVSTRHIVVILRGIDSWCGLCAMELLNLARGGPGS